MDRGGWTGPHGSGDGDLIGTHKTEHYPTNFRGIQTDGSIPIGKGNLKGIFYYLKQMETNIRAGDTIFGDSYFPALANSKPGTIAVWKLSGETGECHRVRLQGYLEQAHFRKNSLADSDDIDKLVTNLTVGPTVTITPHFSLGVSLRHLIATGRWQTMRFHHRQEIPELSLSYRKGENLRATLIYHWYTFRDAIGISAGDNDYEGHQILTEFLWRF